MNIGRVALATIIIAGAVACSGPDSRPVESTPQLVTPSQPVSCTYQLSPANFVIMPNGGRGELTVNTGSGCGWSLIADEWIVFRPSPSGVGPATVSFDVLANASSSKDRQTSIRRRGAADGDESVQIQQLPNCSIVYYEPFAGGKRVEDVVNVPASGGLVKLWTLTEPWRCNWTARPDVPWISVNWPAYPAYFNGDGDISFVVQPNSTGVERRGGIATAIRGLTVIQASR
jgi:hypothetical protein